MLFYYCVYILLTGFTSMKACLASSRTARVVLLLPTFLAPKGKIKGSAKVPKELLLPPHHL